MTYEKCKVCGDPTENKDVYCNGCFDAGHAEEHAKHEAMESLHEIPLVMT